MYALRGMMSSKRELACEAIHIERDILKENVGVQDQIATAYGGLNKIVINPDRNFDVTPIILPHERMQSLQDHMLLFFTGVSRTASDIAGDKIKSIPNKKLELHGIRQIVDEAMAVLTSSTDLSEFGRLLHESWMLKRQISASISPGFIDDIYDKARKAGAIGGKLLGAGGGGFMLFFVKPEDKPQVCEALKDLLLVPFAFESSGSQILFYDNQQHYNPSSIARRDYIHLQEDKADQLRTRERLTRLPEVKAKVAEG
jgi:D-glycero-alpha-D-manno-heptose-7-phosphate kinase